MPKKQDLKKRTMVFRPSFGKLILKRPPRACGEIYKSFLVTGKRSGDFQIVCDEREQPTFLAPPTAPLP